ncbi:FUN14 domain-containing protein [Natronorubrum sulfidifaciens]|uniref:FUN14 family protein n=1 Tax=Natronorubrum sulfidifaciens JCM 14089 TaxID=1230460 RepID=L9VZ43_9EURY|nr:FUN14 domain-containing protein [Natronorubrum sulfidifaciens]ELY42449.1 FUN14 family protein [Natronorubrum sulfidifaciens JCM 14089]
MLDVDPATLALEFGGSAVLGGVFGVATKQVAKLVAVIIGVQLMAFRYLESQEILIVDWNRLSAGLIETQAQTQRQASHWFESVLSMLSVGVGFTSGFLIGFQRG